MPRPLCFVTGGNAGIGYAAVVQLARAGAEVIVATRSAERGAAAVDAARRESGSERISLVQMDLSCRRSVLRGVDAFRSAGHRCLDVLIHNAANFDVSRKEPAYSADNVELIWATNHVHPVLLTQQFERELLASRQGRVITVSSQGLQLQPFLRVRLEDPEFRRGGFRVSRAYYQSKIAQVMYTFWLANRYRGMSITANCVRVTNVKVDLGRYPNVSGMLRTLYAMKSRFSISPAAMAKVYTWLALSPDVARVSGGYFDHRKRSVKAGRYAENPANIRDVMRLTARYVPGLLDDGSA